MLKQKTMKKLVYIVISLLISNSAFSQTNYTPTGLWRFTNNNDTIYFYLKKDQISLSEKNYQILIGFHKYVKNSNVIESTFQDTNTVYSNNKFSILIYDNSNSINPYEGNIQDINLNNKRYIFLTKESDSTINVYLTYLRGVRKNYPYGFTLPRHFTLTRQ